MPISPCCQKEIDTIYTSRTVQLKYKDGKWEEEQADRYCTYGCPECGEESLYSGQTQYYYEYAGGPMESPPETPLKCSECGFEDCV